MKQDVWPALTRGAVLRQWCPATRRQIRRTASAEPTSTAKWSTVEVAVSGRPSVSSICRHG
jgi:hypothetical protein